MSVSGLRPANKRPNSKERDLIGASSRRFTILSDNRSGVISINIF